MNNLSKGAKLLLCIVTGIVGFVIIPGIWTAWQQSMGYKTPGVIFIMIIWGATAAAIRAIWKYQPDDNSSSNSNSSSTDIDRHKLDKN
ncbi:MAG: hypothetical protein Q7J34_05690 [Bacteroidales bacterium]|nr:hypothetical protein [Bacteroidales bacterium]